MRLLAAAAHLNEKVCVPLTHKLFGAYWVNNKGTVLIRKHVLELTQFWPGRITCCAVLTHNRNLAIRCQYWVLITVSSKKKHIITGRSC